MESVLQTPDVFNTACSNTGRLSQVLEAHVTSRCTT